MPILPLTSDWTALTNAINAMTPVGNTNVTIGATWGMATLTPGVPFTGGRPFATPRLSKYMILLTDGVNTAGMLEPRKAAELARDEGVRVHTIAFGGDGSLSLFGFQLPMPGAGDEIDEDTLRTVATLTGGRFFRARDTASLAGIYAEIDRLEPVERPGKAVRPKLERYAWPLSAALLLALLAFAWPRRSRA